MEEEKIPAPKKISKKAQKEFEQKKHDLFIDAYIMLKKGLISAKNFNKFAINIGIDKKLIAGAIYKKYQLDAKRFLGRRCTEPQNLKNWEQNMAMHQ